MLITVSLLFILLGFSPLLAVCPNKCSGHGVCGTQNICQCFEGWTAGAADCSQAVCPYGTAWVDKAYSSSQAHQSAECSNAGTCDRQTGLCACLPGFTGHACQRNTCPADCSGHGECMSIREISIDLGPDYNPETNLYGGDGVGFRYKNWDKNSVYLCVCDAAYIGADCSRRMCPKGDDPLTVNQNYRSIKVVVGETGYYDLKGSIGIFFMGTRHRLFLYEATSASCESDLSHVGQFGEVDCVVHRVDRQHAEYTLTFLSWPSLPTENNLFFHDGNPSLLDFYCDVSEITGELIDTRHHSIPITASCEFVDVLNTNIRENSYCSNRGFCDFSVGDCKCNAGFGGQACSIATYLHFSNDDTLPGLEVTTARFDFQSTLLRINSATKTTNFSFFETVAGGDVTCSLRGDGYLQVNELRTLTGGETIQNGGLYVTNNGMSVYDSGMSVFSDQTTVPVMALTNAYTGPLGSAYSVMRINTLTSSPSTARAVVLKDRDIKCLEVKASGALFIHKAGLQTTGGLSVKSSGLTATGGLSIGSSGLVVKSGGVAVTGGASVFGGGLAILTGGLQVTDGMTLNSGGLYISAGGSSVQGGLALPNSDVKINSGGLVVSGGLSLRVKGLYVELGGATVNSEGLFVRAAGVTVSSGGLSCTGAVTIIQGSLLVSSGLSVASGGIYIGGGGATIINSGMVASQGVTIKNGGLVMTGGITVKSLGVVSTGGLTINDSGMYVIGGVSIGTGGLNVLNGGIYLTDAWTGNGMSVSGDAGLYVNSLFESHNSVYNLGITGDSILGSVTVARNWAYHTGGNVFVAGSLTVQGTTELQFSAGVYSDRQLKTNLLPITGALDKVSRLQGVYFDWIKHERTGLDFDEKRHVGVIAQNVLEVLPEAVDRKDGGSYLGVDYSAMVPLLIEAIHDLEDQIEDLSATRNASHAQEGLTIDRVWSQLQSLQEEVRGLRDQNQWLQTLNMQLMDDIAVELLLLAEAPSPATYSR